MKISEIIVQIIDRFYHPFVARFATRQMFRYAVCGGVNFLMLDPLYYFLIYHYIVTPEQFFDLGFVVMSPHIAALILVFPITFFNGFWLNKYVAFRASPLRTRTQLIRYFLSIFGSILINYIGLKFLVEICAVWPTPAKILTTIITTVYSFMAAKYFSFRHASKQ